MTSQSREQKIKSISKGNQAMKSGQLVEYKMRNFFLESHVLNVAEKLLPAWSTVFRRPCS